MTPAPAYCTQKLTVSVTAEEYALRRAKAARHGLTVEAYILAILREAPL